MHEPSLNAIVSTLKTSRPPTPEERFVQLEKILNSQVFHGSEILKSFLRFVVGKSLEGLESEVKEYTIATEVFGRNANYDPRIDSLVLAIVAYRYYMEAKQFRQYAISNRVDLTFVQDIAPFWAEFLNTGSPLLVAYSNPVFRGNLANGLKYWAPLEASTPTLRPPSLSRVVDSPAATDIYTGVGEVMGVNFLGNLFWKVGNPFRVERSLLL